MLPQKMGDSGGGRWAMLPRHIAESERRCCREGCLRGCGKPCRLRRRAWGNDGISASLVAGKAVLLRVGRVCRWRGARLEWRTYAAAFRREGVGKCAAGGWSAGGNRCSVGAGVCATRCHPQAQCYGDRGVDCAKTRVNQPTSAR